MTLICEAANLDPGNDQVYNQQLRSARGQTILLSRKHTFKISLAVTQQVTNSNGSVFPPLGMDAKKKKKAYYERKVLN